MKFAGIITAAGMSSRMGSFKPLMQINGFPMIYITVQSMKNAGLDPICVVTGHRGAEIESALKDCSVIFARNHDPEGTDMLASVKLGLEKIKNSDGFFLLPGDMPLVPPSVFKALKSCAEISENPYIVPSYNGRNAHPPFISSSCYEKILMFNQDGGLPAALSSVAKASVETGNAVSNMDADFPEEFEAVSLAAKKQLGISKEIALKLLEAAKTKENIRIHCQAVADLALNIADTLIDKGFCLDRTLIYSSALLHDVCRTEKKHALIGANYIKSAGYDRIADIILHHMTFDGLSDTFDEYTIVCLADKLIKSGSRVSPQERYAPAMNKYPEGTEIGDRVRRDLNRCLLMCDNYSKITGLFLC